MHERGGVILVNRLTVSHGVLAFVEAENVNVRTLLRIPESRAVAIEGETDPYVRSGICTATGPSGLVRCLTPAR